MKTTAEKLQEFFKMFQPFMKSEIKNIITDNLIEGHSFCNLSDEWRYIWINKEWHKIESIKDSLRNWFNQMYGDEL